MKSNRIKACYVLLGVLLLLLILMNMLIGSSSMTMGDALRILFSHDTASKYGKIIWDIRMPRILAAALLGGALSVSGFLLQTFFANPIAGPYILGISSGAKLVVACTMVFALTHGMMVHSVVMIIAAFAGSIAVTGVILLISDKVRSMSILIVCGVMVGYICSAVTEFLVTFADDSNIVNLHNWSMGSFSAVSWDNIRVITVVVVISVISAFMLSKPMSAFQMGEQYARSVGGDIKAFRISLITLSMPISIKSFYRFSWHSQSAISFDIICITVYKSIRSNRRNINAVARNYPIRRTLLSKLNTVSKSSKKYRIRCRKIHIDVDPAQPICLSGLIGSPV